MRYSILAAAFMLTACASTPPAAPVSAGAPTPGAPPSRVLQLLSQAGRGDAPTQAEIQRVLGAPDITRQEGAGAALTYRLETCALLLLFQADSRNALRLSEAHPSARRAGQAAPTLEQCAAEANAPRS